jgi:cytochrome c6
VKDSYWQLLDRILWGLAIGVVILGLALPARAIENPVIDNPVTDPIALVKLAPEQFTQAASLFELQCSGCHINGSNIIRRGKNLKLKALQANHVDSPEAISALITNGKGIMSAYADRLSSAEIELLASYVLEQANAGWPS